MHYWLRIAAILTQKHFPCYCSPPSVSTTWKKSFLLGKNWCWRLNIIEKASPVKELCFSTSSKPCQVLASFTQVFIMSPFSIWLRFELGIYEANFNFNGINSDFRHPTLCLFLLSVTTQPNSLAFFSHHLCKQNCCVLMLALLTKQSHPEFHIHILPVPSGFSVLGISFHSVCLPFPIATLVSYIILKPVLLWVKPEHAISWGSVFSVFWVHLISFSKIRKYFLKTSVN